ncbi:MULTISPECIES: hypothetical protein [Marivita]|uniref:Uncharacterized protein n=1 Tax=Marivita cryptomonadis TaxID=505252 RepID=A0A9Q2NY89_9RHOB|nr:MULTISPECIES: hypothetical protein [Marivita]MCR9167642.1 hypothetical protein [Paracoccaceae bacterium]MBM2322047.1 hypothetical protein [Marivita cryptomonadis]MBM2331628.1 hypothetical protein [Marivita cryptomonadis]MBM2341213.1 hypothetical protein [Marivita cryptomonadis]MBM2345876.1 hypothetical protein [Marivita cryptomonadis]
MKKLVTALGLAILTPALAFADGAPRDQWGRAGILSSANKADLPPITLSSGMPLAEAPWVLSSGTYYEFEIEGDGSAELALEGSEFFRAIWIDEIVVNDLEIRPIGVNSIEFDDAGTMEIGFVAIKPGTYFLRIPGSTGETQRLDITIE